MKNSVVKELQKQILNYYPREELWIGSEILRWIDLKIICKGILKLEKDWGWISLFFRVVLTIVERGNNFVRLFNIREGLKKEMDYFPERFLKETLKECPAKGRVVELNKLRKENYQVQILTLQDNNIDLTTVDNNEIIQRALPIQV